MGQRFWKIVFCISYRKPSIISFHFPRIKLFFFSESSIKLNKNLYYNVKIYNRVAIMKQTETLVVGASISGLASASSLQKQGIEYIIIEKEAQVATTWRNHYERLHLHTNKRVSNLPYKKFDSTVPRYPSRRQVVEYLQ